MIYLAAYIVLCQDSSLFSRLHSQSREWWRGTMYFQFQSCCRQSDLSDGINFVNSVSVCHRNIRLWLCFVWYCLSALYREKVVIGSLGMSKWSEVPPLDCVYLWGCNVYYVRFYEVTQSLLLYRVAHSVLKCCSRAWLEMESSTTWDRTLHY